jgi:hypothetical protein
MGAPEIREVEIFLVMAEELHFRRAADRLYLSPSRVSQAVRALEDRVGARLFDRTNRWVRLTPLGESCWIGPARRMRSCWGPSRRPATWPARSPASCGSGH